MNSTLRSLALPSRVVLSLIGFESPNSLAVNLDASTPICLCAKSIGDERFDIKQISDRRSSASMQFLLHSINAMHNVQEQKDNH